MSEPSDSNAAAENTRETLHAPVARLVWVLLGVAALLFVTELTVMRILPALGLQGIWEDVADSVLLTVLALGPLYLVGFRSSHVSDHGARRPDRLFLTFVLASIGAVFAIGLLVGLSTRYEQRGNVVANAERSAIEIAAALRDHQIKEFVDHAGGDAGLVITPEAVPELDGELRAFLAPFSIVKIKVFDRQARIIYSTDRSIIGKLDRGNPMLEDALEGLATSKLEAKHSVVDLEEEQRFDVDVVETYVPVAGPGGNVLGSLEIYKDVTRELRAGEASWRSSLLTLFVVLLCVFTGLSAIMHRAARVIRFRGAELERSRDESLEASALLAEQTARANDLAAKAETASAVKSEFLANMSHEIRTPMTAVLGFAETLLDPDLSEQDKVNAVQTVRRNGEHLLQIINDILDISKIEAGKVEVECIRCSPVQVVADAEELMQIRAKAKNLPFNIEFIGTVPETIQSDPTRLKQILVNLISNAIKFTDVGGVRLLTRFIEADPIGGTDQAEPMMQFDIIDSGIGMTPQQMGKLFKSFSQADTSTTRKFGGTGLGLMISKRLAEMLGGDLAVFSEPGRGSTFRVRVATGSLDDVNMLDDPTTAAIVCPENAAAMQVDAAELDGRILLAEDGKDNQRLIGHILTKVGAEVIVVANGKLAAEAALAARDSASPFDVILMDMQMPVMDGYEATRLLRQKGYTGRIIALTAHAMASDRQKCIDAGCDDYATKPIDRASLIATLATHMSKGENLAPSQENPPDGLVSELADEHALELVEMFVGELPGKIAAIEKAIGEQDLAALGTLAHQMKGSAKGFGFPAITQAAKLVESNAKAGADLDAIAERVRSLIELCSQVRATTSTK